MSAERAREIRQLQKAKEKAQRGGHLVEEAALCNQLGEILASCGRYEEALEEHRQELRLLEGAGDGLGCAVAHRKIGERLAEMENYEAALKHQHQHLELARGLADETEQQRAWATIGRTYMFMAESDGTVAQEAWRKAERAFHTSLTIVEEKLEGAVPDREVTEMRTRLYLNLGLVYDSLKDPAKSHQYIRKSIFLADQGRLTEDLYRAYFNLGHIQLREGDHSGALRCLARARDCARKMKEKGLESDCCSSTAQVLLSLGDFAAAKRSLKQAYLLGPSQPWQRDLLRSNLRYATKVTRLQEALEEAAAPPLALSLSEQLGDIFSKQGDYGRAVEAYQRQLSLAQQLGRPPREVAVIHVSLATTFGDLKDYARAIHHYRQELALHRGDALEEGKTWLNMALAMEEAGEPPPHIQSCLQTALERAQVAGDPRVQRQALRQLHALQLRLGEAEAAAATLGQLGGLGGAPQEEEEDLESSQAQEEEEESELELSESEGEDDELEGYSKSVPGRRRICKWNRRNERGETPLHRACIEGDLRRVLLFLKQGHPLNPRDYCGWTPLHEACNHGHLEIVQALLERGAAVNDPGGPGCEGITPLHDALSCGHFEVAQELLRRGASVNARDSQGLTPLGTLERWLQAYGPELDQETWQRCQHTQSLLRQAAAPALSQLSQDSVPEGDGDAGAGDMVPLKPVRKRLRAPVLDGRDVEGLAMEPEPCGAAAGGLGSAKSLSGGTKSICGGTESLPNDARSLPSGAKSLLGNAKSHPGGAKSHPGGAKSHPGGAKSLFGTTKPLPSGANPLPGGTNPSVSSGTVAGCRPPALIPVEQYLEEEDWLEDDLGGARGGRKRPRRDPQGLVSALGDGTGAESDSRGPAVARHRARRCRQSRLTGLVRRGWREQRPPEAAGSPLSGEEEEEVEEEEEEGGVPTPAAPGPVPGPQPTLRVRVRVQDSVFLIPVPQRTPHRTLYPTLGPPYPLQDPPQNPVSPFGTPISPSGPPTEPCPPRPLGTLLAALSAVGSPAGEPPVLSSAACPRSSPPLAVSWLAERAAQRFYQGCGLLPRLSLRREGALLAPQDPVGDVLQSNEEVLAEVQGWDLPPLAERYRRACQSLAVDAHPLLLKALELQEQSPALLLGGGLSLSPPQLPPLLRALKLQERLQQLRLQGCGVTDAAGGELLATLGTLPALTQLDLTGNRLGARGLRDLLPQQPHTFQSLEELNLSLNPLGDASCRPLAELLRRCPALTTLRLDACGFTAAFHLEGKSPWQHHGAALASLGARAPRLQRLSLSHNALGAAGLARLLGALPCHSLARLELGSISGPAPQPLAPALVSFLAQEGCALSHLRLSGNHLSDGDILQVARCLPACPALVSLDFSANPGITTAGLRSLLSALEERHQGLQFLSLAGCSVEAPLEAESAGKIQELRLCGHRARAGEAWQGAARLRTVTRHHKLFWKNL
ncbi:tonsoku-like protein [Dryobates pubescens]|uniref:tonsoku-like protein n=1 Tax=Dryobates pubescens TaxID=118200 RepID=UPI0023BA06C8|nr:tonsoku-like protein [Dryobates pubescens]